MTTDADAFATERGAASAHLPTGSPTRGWRLLDRIILVGALVGLLVPGTLLAAGLHARRIENRPLAELPPLSAAGLVDASWFEGVNRYLADNLWVRTLAVRVRGEAYFAAGGTGTPEVVRGRDDWLFARNAFDPACRNTGAGLAATLSRAAAAFAAAGVTFRFVGTPDKQAIYPDKVAPHPFPRSCLDDGRDELRAGVAALGPSGIDGWTILEAARAAHPDEPLYYRGDTHWTPFGALQVLRPLITSLDSAAWNEAEVQLEGTRPRVVDLGRQVGIRRVERTTDVRPRPGVKPIREDVAAPVELRNWPTIFRTRVPAPPVIGGRTLIICDSYFRIHTRLIAPYFEDATWIHIGDLSRNPQLYELLGPFDTVIVERVERFVYGDDLATLFDRLTAASGPS